MTREGITWAVVVPLQASFLFSLPTDFHQWHSGKADATSHPRSGTLAKPTTEVHPPANSDWSKGRH